MIDLSQHHEAHGRVWLALAEHSGSGKIGAEPVIDFLGLLGTTVLVGTVVLIGLAWGVRWAWRRWW